MITLNGISKNYGSKVLFDGISLNINQGEKIGLIGPNGAGKSTLFSMILGEVEPSGGSVQVKKNTRIGYLPQEASFSSAYTVLSEICRGDKHIQQLREEKTILERKNEADSKRYGDILHELEVLGYFELEHKAKKILMGLSFKEGDFDKPITALSGGWQMRTLLAKLLTLHYDLLLLDEPTNYLDLNAALWLKDYLSAFRGAFVIISHDKAFLNEVCNYALILEQGSIFKVKGNYEHYEAIKREKRAYLIKQFKEYDKKRRQLEEFVARFHAQPNKASQVRAKRTMLEKMQQIVVPDDVSESMKDFDFPQAKRSGQRVIRLKKISKSYGDVCVYKDFDFEIDKGEKAVLAGENGAGKSTLLKILAGAADIDNGERIIGHNVETGYFSQTRMDVLNPDNTVLDEAYSAAKGHMKQESIRTILGAFLFRGNDVDKKVKVLSGGEKSRLILAKLLINPPNFLLLDEPTTHLDVDSVDALVKALDSYEGTIVFISHDIHFTRMIANCVFEVKNGRVRKFPGNFDYFLDKRKEQPVNQEKQSKKSEKEPGVKKESLLKEEKKSLPGKEKEEGRKNDNAGIKEEIESLRREREALELERYAEERVLSEPKSYHSDDLIEQYRYRVKEIEKRLAEISKEIRQFRSRLDR